VQRTGLALFGTLFVLLFIGVGLAVGIESSAPAVPPHAVAAIEGAPPGIGVISRAEIDGEIAREAAVRGLRPAPEPGEPEYELLKDEMLYRLIRAAWFRSEARRLGVPVTAKQIAERMQPEETRTLRKAGFSQPELEEHQRWQLVEDNVLNLIKAETPGSQEQKEAAAVAGELELLRDWRSRTYCRVGYVTVQCSNFPDFEREAWVPRECYEANPKTPAEACPPPVLATKPAVPGSVRPPKPEGDRLVQGPMPEGE
jgi:hypothetical protein